MTRGAIWIIGDVRTSRHWQNSLKVLAKAKPLAAAAQVPLEMVLLGASAGNDAPGSAPQQRPELSACQALEDAAGQAARRGLQSVYCVTHDDLAVPRTDVYAQVLADLVRQHRPWLVLLTLNDFGRETAAFCAQHCQTGLIADCSELVFNDGQVLGRCPAWGGQILADITLAEGWSCAFVTVQPHGAADPPEEVLPNVRIENIVLEKAPRPSGLQLMERTLEPMAQHRLEEAETVVVGGAGLGDVRGFGLVRELAAALGAEVGATRPPVLYHWVDEARLIGQTGKSVHPRLLISVGTSGAVQYTAGIMEADTVVAINRDPKAPIFQLADIGIVADAATFLPLLIQRAKQVVMRKLADAACSLDQEQMPDRGGFGALVRQLRQARSWSQAELAQATGQTPDFIEQVESDQMSPPVAFILRMAQAMQVDPSTFLNKEEQVAIRDRRAQAYYQRTQHYSYTTLTPEAENNHLRAFMVTIEAQHAHKPVAYKHEGEEFVFVIAGDLELTLGSKVHVLKTGESLHFNSDIPHKLKSLSNEPTRCLVVLYTL